MKTIKAHFEDILAHDKNIFVPYMMAGDGGVEHLADQLLFLEQCGASAIEVGIPFSDPVADGPTIQAAGLRSLQAGTTLEGIFKELYECKEQRGIPVIIMAYANVVHAYGIDAFASACVHAGVQGVLIPDIPLEEESIITPALKRAGVEWIRLVALTSTDKRIEQLTKDADGFMYAVSDTGTTGVRTEQRQDLYPFLQRVKEKSPVPVLVGFGISTADQVHTLQPYCDGVIVGSAIVDLLHHQKGEQVRTLIRESTYQ